MRKLLLGLSVTILVLAGCSGQSSDGEAGSNQSSRDSTPDYEIINQEEFPIGNSGMSGTSANISTEVSDANGYRTICDGLREEFPDSAALTIGYYAPLSGREFDPSDIEGTCQWFEDAGVASYVLGPGYTEENVENIMQERDGYLIISLDELEAEMSGMMEEITD